MKKRQCYFLFLDRDSFFLRALFLFIGAMLLIAGFSKLFFYVDLRLTGTKTVGIIEHPATTTVLGGRPLVQYEDATGKTHEFRSKVKTHWFSKPQKGETLSVLYDNKGKQREIVNNFVFYVFLPLGFIVVGAYFLLHAFKSGAGFIQRLPNRVYKNSLDSI